MYNVSTQYMQAVQSTSRLWDMYVVLTLSDGTELRLDRKNLEMNKTKLKEGSTCSSTIQLGSTYSNSFEFTILNSQKTYTEYDFYLAKVQPFVGLDVSGSGDFEYVPLGIFNILDNVKRFSTIPIVCFDNMSMLNKPFKFEHLVFPIKCSDLFRELLTQCNVSYRESILAEVDQLTYEINSLLTNEPSCRDILAGFGIMLQKNFRFDREGYLESFWYQRVEKSTDTTTRVGNSSYSDNIITVTGVYLEDAYGNVFSVGTEDYAVELPTSPIIQGSEMATELLELALESLQAVSYIPSSVSFIGDPALQAGDILEHRDTSVGTLFVPIMVFSYKFAGTSILESLGTDQASQTQRTSSEKRSRKAFAVAAKDKAELITRITQTAQTIELQVSETYATKDSQADLIVQVDGVSSSVRAQEASVAEVREQLTSVQQTSEQLDLKIQQIATNGVSRVVTTTGYTLDAEGLKISKSGEEMTNKVTNKGMYVTRSGETILQADSSGVVATDVKVRNYLIIGSHARFEDYNDGTDSSRTACFYI